MILYGLSGILIRPKLTPPIVNVKPHTVAIVDGLGGDYPNETLINSLVKLFESKGYHVVLYNSTEVTVNFMGSVLCSNYDIVIFRIHGGKVYDQNGRESGFIAFFTNEPYSPDKYMDLQVQGLVGRGIPALNPEKRVFVVTPLYVSSLSCNTHPKIIIVASCYSMYGTSMAEALVKKGVKVYIGWDGLVYASVNDAVLYKLVEGLLNGDSVSESVLKTYNNAWGDSRLLYYPSKAGSLTLSAIEGHGNGHS